MKHAVLITSYNELDHLTRLVSYFSRDCYVFLHIDRKLHVPENLYLSLASCPNVLRIYRKYNVHWGGYSILKCEMFLLNEAIRLCDAEYFHIISGQDYPIRPLADFLSAFEMNKGKEFISFVHLPNPLWQDNTFQRFTRYYFNDWIRNPRGSKLAARILTFQSKHNIKRKLPDYFPHLYGSSQWMSLTRRSVCALLAYTRRHPAFYRYLRYSFAPEEIYIATVLCNFIKHEDIVHNHRFIRWKTENGSKPAILSEEHFRLFLVIDNLLARKFSDSVSSKLLGTIDRYLHHDGDISFTKTGGWVYDGFLRYRFKLDVASAINKYIKVLRLRDGVDFGCGCGMYVSYFRNLGFPMMGYDANPYVGKLSSVLLPKNDMPCEACDLTETLEEYCTFDIVLCLDVLSCIPYEMIENAVDNLMRLMSKSLIVSFKEDAVLSSAIKSHVERHGLYVNEYFSCKLHEIDKELEYYVLENVRNG